MRFTSLCLGLSVLSFASGCSSDLSTPSSVSIRERENPVVVAMGGFKSCLDDGSGRMTPAGTARWNKAERISNRFADGAASWVRSCFDGVGNIFFVTSSAPQVAQRATIAEPIPFFRAILAETGDGARPLYLIGHSYGGWLGMYAAYWMPDRVRVNKLFTIDPISPYSCSWVDYAAAAASPITAPWLLQGCQEAPRDFDDGHKARIVGRLPERSWAHYYQRNFLPLRSDAFAGVAPARNTDASPFLSVSDAGAHASWNAHVGVDELSVVWYSFEQSIAGDLSL